MQHVKAIKHKSSMPIEMASEFKYWLNCAILVLLKDRGKCCTKFFLSEYKNRKFNR